MNRVPANAPVAAFDLDGTLGDYHAHFFWFLQSIYMPHEMHSTPPMYRIPTWYDKYKGEFSEALGLNKHDYRDAKLAYRQGGLKRSIPPMSDRWDLIKMVQDLRASGIAVWVCTTRPWMRLDNIDADTQYWVQHNMGKVDGLVYGEDKYQNLIDNVGKERILGVADDLPENIEEAQRLGLRAILRRGAQNMYWPANDTLVTNSTEGIFNQMKEWAAAR